MISVLSKNNASEFCAVITYFIVNQYYSSYMNNNKVEWKVREYIMSMKRQPVQVRNSFYQNIPCIEIFLNIHPEFCSDIRKRRPWV